MYYGARYYLPGLRRFVSADTVVPSAVNGQALNRYSYVYNNPLKYTDPTGHRACIDGVICGGGNIGEQVKSWLDNNSGSSGSSGNDDSSRTNTSSSNNTSGNGGTGGDGENNPRAQVADPEHFGYPSIETLESVYHEWVFSNPHYTRYAGIDNHIILELIQSTAPAWQNYLPPAPTFQEWSFYHGYVLNTYGDRILSAPGGVDFAQMPSIDDAMILVGVAFGGTGAFGAPMTGTGVQSAITMSGDTTAYLSNQSGSVSVNVDAAAALLGV